MANINPIQAAVVLIDDKGKRKAFEYIFQNLKQSNEIGEMHSYHDWADVLRAYARLIIKRTPHHRTVH